MANKIPNGCNCKFVYHDEEYGSIVLRCGVWTKMKGSTNHQKLKWCYDCLDDFAEDALVSIKEICKCGHHTNDHSHPYPINLDNDDLECDKCDCKKYANVSGDEQ